MFHSQLRGATMSFKAQFAYNHNEKYHDSGRIFADHAQLGFVNVPIASDNVVRDINNKIGENIDID